MTQYERVREILRKASGTGTPFHDGKGTFWELPLADFVNLQIYGVALVAPAGPDRGANSGLVKALKGEKPFDGTRFSRMPLGRPPVAPPDIQFIQDWIDAGCPDELPSEPAELAMVESVAAAAPPPIRGITTTNLVRQERSQTLKVRKNIQRLDETELAKYRAAVARLKALPATDPRNWENLAAIHREHCNDSHGTEWFAPWHRAYLYNFEKAMQEMVPAVMLPYWDWVKTAELPARYRGNSGNPLFDPTRDPGAFGDLPTEAEVRSVQQESPSFGTYGGKPRSVQQPGRLENEAHNGVHGWVAGNMRFQDTSPLDPIFWAHHANVDRLWHLWSEDHPGAVPVELDEPLVPFSFTARQVLSIDVLGYEYAAGELLFMLDRDKRFSSFETPRFSAGGAIPGDDFRRAELQLLQVPPPVDSATVRVFVGEENATAATPLDRPTYAGRFALFGKNRCIGGPGHCDIPRAPRPKFDLRPPHHMQPADIHFDITRAMKAALSAGGEVTVTLVAVDGKGRPLEAGILNADAVAIVFKDW